MSLYASMPFPDTTTALFYEKILTFLPQYVFWKDINSVYLGCNEQFAQLVGLSHPKNIVGKTDDTLPWQASGHTAESFRRDDQTILSGGVISNKIENLALPQGRTLITLVSKQAITDDDGHPIGIAGYFTDITHLKATEAMAKQAKAQAAKERNRAQEEETLRQAVMVITGSIVHDLRTPITTLLLNSERLEQLLYDTTKTTIVTSALENHNTQQYVHATQHQQLLHLAHSFGKVANDMSAYIQHSLTSLRNTLIQNPTLDDLLPCSMQRCIKQAVDGYPWQAHEESLIHTELTQDFSFLGNEILMIRVIHNLIKNALAAIAHHRRGALFIRLEPGVQQNTLRFKDTAGSVLPENFDAWFDGYHSSTDGGFGIGLAFCKKTIKDFQGEIQCQGNSRDYVEFIIHLPHHREGSNDNF